MPTPIEHIDAAAMKLSPEARADAAEKLCPSLQCREDVEAEWDVEIARRIRQIDAGEVECLPWETVMAELRAQFS
ncbi:MAG TPA: addiction module protein [Rubrivivax sp.]|jgi:putative addiction module component (TIGR02574 family)|nr:addiction module protein [Rubrivivax sp.]